MYVASRTSCVFLPQTENVRASAQPKTATPSVATYRETGEGMVLAELPRRVKGRPAEIDGIRSQPVRFWPKSMTWRLRSRVGERVRWYETPEEVRH